MKKIDDILGYTCSDCDYHEKVAGPKGFDPLTCGYLHLRAAIAFVLSSTKVPKTAAMS
jgi:hypothetical protein